MNTHTTVYQVSNPDHTITYTLPPREAVKAAHCQSIGNWNTWTYDNDPEPIVAGRYHWFCGDFAARR